MRAVTGPRKLPPQAFVKLFSCMETLGVIGLFLMLQGKFHQMANTPNSNLLFPSHAPTHIQLNLQGKQLTILAILLEHGFAASRDLRLHKSSIR